MNNGLMPLGLKNKPRVSSEYHRTFIRNFLVKSPGIEFCELRAMTKMTDGNLYHHLRVMLNEGEIEFVKTGAGRGSKTTIWLKKNG